jgi:Tfp pilus assembly protein PilO
VTLTDRDRKILLAIVPILVIVAYWFLLLSPKREQASMAADALAKQEQRRDQAQAAAEAGNSAKKDFDADYTQIVRLGKAIPAQVDMPSLVVQLDAAAAGTGIRFTKIAQGARVAAPAATPPPNPGSESGEAGTPAAANGAPAQSAPGAAVESANAAQQAANDSTAGAEQSGVDPTDTQTSTPSDSGLPVGGGTTAPGVPGAASTGVGGLETVPLEMEFVGNFFNLADFFHRIKRFVRVANQNVVVSGRLITVEGVRWSSDPEIFPRVRAEISATVYLSPKAQGATAGATPQGPPASLPTAPATPAETTPAPGTAPTAAATP